MDARRLSWHIILTTNVTLIAYIFYSVFAYRPAVVTEDVQTELQLFENHYYKIMKGPKFIGTIYFSTDLGEDIVGQCISSGTPFINTIKIHPKRWEEFTQYAKEELIFHEMGHCIHGLSHDNGKKYLVVLGKQQLCPKSLMNAKELIGGDCYRFNRNYYIQEYKEKAFNSMR